MEGIHQLVRKDLQLGIFQMLSVISITLIICSTITIIQESKLKFHRINHHLSITAKAIIHFRTVAHNILLSYIQYLQMFSQLSQKSHKYYQISSILLQLKQEHTRKRAQEEIKVNPKNQLQDRLKEALDYLINHQVLCFFIQMTQQLQLQTGKVVFKIHITLNPLQSC